MLRWSIRAVDMKCKSNEKNVQMKCKSNRMYVEMRERVMKWNECWDEVQE